jgi:probable rRNA maturation factor
MRPRLRSVEAALRRAIADGDRRGRAEILFTTDAHIAGLAGRYRGSPRPTDVLAFPEEEAGFAGSIAISLDTARRQARERGVSLTEELILLSVHGLLHLGGLGDESIPEWCAMRVLEFETLVRIL